MRIRKLNHSVYQLQYHIVWGTKYRRKILKAYVRDELVRSLYKLLRKHRDWYIHEINTGEDHVHMLLEIPPKYALDSCIREMKKYSSKQLQEQFKFIRQIYSEKEGMWSVGYFVSSVGLNEAQIRKYIQIQKEEDIGKEISQEFA